MIEIIFAKIIDVSHKLLGKWWKQRLSPEEKKIIKEMQTTKQNAHIFKVDSPVMPAFVKVGNTLFHSNEETAQAREYVEATRSLASKEYVEDIGNETYTITSKGLKLKF